MKRALLSALACLALPLTANASIVYNSWVTNEGDSGNYILTITDQSDGDYSFELTVDPWNAEALALYVDLGDKDVSSLAILGDSVQTDPYVGGSVSILATDVAPDENQPFQACSACKLNGLNAPVIEPDGEWEMVFQLGETGYEGIQSFSWILTGLYDISESDFGLIGIRAQNLCEDDSLLTEESSSGCGGSDKSYNDVPNVPLPAAVWLFGSALIGFAGFGKYRRSHA